MQFYIPACCVIKLAIWNQTYIYFLPSCQFVFERSGFSLTDVYCKAIDINSAVLCRVLPSVEYEQSGRTPFQFLKICYCFASTSEQLLEHGILVSRFETFIENVLILFWTLFKRVSVNVFLPFYLYLYFLSTSPVHPGRSEDNQSCNTHKVEENCLSLHLQYMFNLYLDQDFCWFTAKT